MITNKYNGRCQSCGDSVSVGKGFVYKNGSRWFTVCKSKACHRRLGIEDLDIPKKKSQSRVLTEDGEIFMSYDPNALPMLRSMPGAQWNPEKKCWKVSTKPADIARVVEISDKLGCDVPSKFRDVAENGTVESQEAIERAKRTRSDGKTLYPYQTDGVEFLALHDRALLADDMGVGKTIQALVALPNAQKVLVICPAAVKYNWRNETRMWRPDYETKIISGKKGFVMPGVGEIVIVNYDILPAWLKPTKDTGKRTKKGDKILEADLSVEQRQAISETIVICDESHNVKNYKAMRSKKVTELCKVAKVVWFLTGTPLLTRPIDLYGMLASGGMYPLGGWYKFTDLFNGYKNKWGGWVFGMPNPEVRERLKRVMLRRLKKDVLPDLPPKTYQRLEVNDISKSLKARVDQLMVDCAEHEGVETNGNYVEDLDLESLPDFEEFSRIRAELAKARIPAMIEVVEGYEDAEEPLVVFSAHRSPVDALASREGWAVITGDVSASERARIVDDFQAGKLKGLALTIQAGGVGLTLTRASNVLFVDLDWTPALNIQAEDRVCRIGQTSNSVVIKRMVSTHPMDIHVQNLIEYKMELAYQALDKGLEYKKPVQSTVPELNKSDLVDETDEDLAARINDAVEQANRAWARSKIQKISDREAAKVDDIPMPELTPARKTMLKGALAYMVSVCDGAVHKDGMGFNRPDAAIGHWIAATGLRNDDDETFRVLERILCRYRRQLKGEFGAVWKPEME